MVVDTADMRATRPAQNGRGHLPGDNAADVSDSPVASMLAAAIRPAQGGREVTVKSSPKGLWIDPRTPYDLWKAVGLRLRFAPSPPPGGSEAGSPSASGANGRRYREALQATGLDYQTLRNYAAVARRFKMSRRRDNLSFQHHAELCALPDDAQDHWLDLAAKNGWSKRELTS